MKVNRDNLDRLIVSIQFDRWIFGFPTRFTLVSHEDVDHDPLKSSFRFPEPLIYSDNYVPRMGAKRKTFSSIYISEGSLAVIKRVKVTPVGPRTLSRLIGIRVRRLHAFWWFLATRDLLVLFVGDLYASEIELLGKLLDEVSDLDAVLLVSYGGMAPPKHGVRYRDQMMVEIGELARREKEKGRILYGLPHPVIPEWADRSAQRV
mgnify:CR=1 FL=1